ncbi:MAG TPA: ribonuclease P protein component [Gammaproteobacteria bacterium]|nr:ribonuclease P protein component [Gammaproteobacteria bacterium]
MAGVLSMPGARRAGRGCQSDCITLCPGSRGFSRRVRLTEPADYQRVFKHCQCKAVNRWLTVLAVVNTLDHPRLGLAISRKVARHAVARNRIKRVVRESFRHRQSELGTLDIVVLGRNDVAGQSTQALATAMEKLWTQLIQSCAGSSSN